MVLVAIARAMISDHDTENNKNVFWNRKEDPEKK